MASPSSLRPRSAVLRFFILVTTMCAARLENGIVTRQRHHSLTTQHNIIRSSSLQHKSSVLLVRGGQSPADPYSNNYAGYNHPPPTQNTNNPEDGFANYNPPTDLPDTEHLFQETVQDRVDKWRQEQMAQSQKMTPLQEINPRDSQGRMKLLASVSRGSRALIFFIVMWRDIHLFELADQSFKGIRRTFTVIPLILLFIGNLAGVVASFTSPSHSSKKRMKAILNLDKLVEVLLLFWYFIRLTIFPTKHVPREIFVAKTLHSVLFLVQLQAFTRVNWDEIIPDGSKGAGALGGKGKPQMTPPPPGFARNEYVTGPPEPTYTNSQDDPYTDYDSGPQTSYY